MAFTPPVPGAAGAAPVPFGAGYPGAFGMAPCMPPFGVAPYGMAPYGACTPVYGPVANVCNQAQAYTQVVPSTTVTPVPNTVPPSVAYGMPVTTATAVPTAPPPTVPTVVPTAVPGTAPMAAPFPMPFPGMGKGTVPFGKPGFAGISPWGAYVAPDGVGAVDGTMPW